ncbi:MAG: hypothetical protein ABIJ10_05355 [Candidatus Micrarchaeota archaeon]
MDDFEITNPMYTNRIKKILEENYRIKSIEIEHDMIEAEPGQFLMVWIPGLGERPMSIANNRPLTISVANVGTVSGELHKLKQGEQISYRGPLGRPFDLGLQYKTELKCKTTQCVSTENSKFENKCDCCCGIDEASKQESGHPKLGTGNPKHILTIGGGYGVVPMYFLCKTAREHGIDAYAIIGGRCEKDVVYEKHLFVVCKEVFVTTDDGSRGKKGTVMTEFEWLIKEKKFDCVYTCGPEKMMKAIAEKCVALKIPCQVSLERHMKCGTGVCGSCAINGMLTCKDGPVFDAEQVLKFSEFGKVSRDGCGNRKEM